MQHPFRDPVCGMGVHGGTQLSVMYRDQPFYFCSDYCKTSFLKAPEKYAPPTRPPTSARSSNTQRIAYFSMEVAVDFRMPTYSGGLGVLAGDTLRSAADLKVPIVAVTLLPALGYFEQQLDEWGNQKELPVVWDPSLSARKLPITVEVAIEGRTVRIGAWQYDIVGVTGHTVPLILLDTREEGNSQADRELTAWLYGGDQRYRLAQEIILGIGGVRMLRALGYTSIERYHMNEGHAALLVLELLRESGNGDPAQWNFNDVRRQCVFTTHTPIPAGHDQFPYDLVQRVLGEPLPGQVLRMLGGADRLNMTLLGLNMSGHLNGVAKKHGEVSQAMFPGYAIDSITNGVHSLTWTSESFQHLFDQYIPGWRNDPSSLRHAVSIPNEAIWDAHLAAKEKLLDLVSKQGGHAYRSDVLTIGFARRATSYKRADLVFADLERLKDIARTVGPIQMVFAGKAHPMDHEGKAVIRRVFEAARKLGDQVRVIYLANYDVALAALLTAGCDVWLNTPLRPLEASGTSGMKAAHNGVPSFSVLDGWWIEGHIEGATGWAIGDLASQSENRDAEDLYAKLRSSIVPSFYRDHDRWVGMMRNVIAFNASFFNTHRMVQQYAASAYV